MKENWSKIIYWQSFSPIFSNVPEFFFVGKNPLPSSWFPLFFFSLSLSLSLSLSFHIQGLKARSKIFPQGHFREEIFFVNGGRIFEHFFLLILDIHIFETILLVSIEPFLPSFSKGRTVDVDCVRVSTYLGIHRSVFLIVGRK